MTEAELQAIERKLPWDVPQMAGAQTAVTAGEIRALIAEVRRREEPSGRPEYTGPCAGLHKRIRLTDDAPRPESERDAERFRFLQSIHLIDAQAFFWNHGSRKERAKAIDAAIDAAHAQEKPDAEK